MQDDDSIPEQTSRVTGVNSHTWRRTAIAIVITALVTGTAGYLLGLRTNQNVSQGIQRVSFQPTPTITAQSSPYQQTGWISPSKPYNPTPTSQPTGTLIIHSQSISPDGQTTIMIKMAQKLVIGSPRQIIISNSSEARETVVMSSEWLGGGFADLKPTNWSPDGKYVYIYESVIEGGDLYVFKASGEPFPNGKTYLLASELGYPQMPLTPTWIASAQIQLIGYQQGPIVTNKTVTYILDVEKRTVTSKQ